MSWQGRSWRLSLREQPVRLSRQPPARLAKPRAHRLPPLHRHRQHRVTSMAGGNTSAPQEPLFPGWGRGVLFI